MDEERLVPEQRMGGKTGATAEISLDSTDEARRLFHEVCRRLIDVNGWFDYAGRKGTKFQLADNKGKLIDRKAQMGDLIRIEIPAPRNKEGDNYDWVIIEKVERSGDDNYRQQSFGFRTRPVSNPGNEHIKEAHFYGRETTSTFLVCRSGTTVYAMERGRNEKPNLDGSFWNNVRNFFVGLGAMLGLSVPMWKLWAESMLKPHNNA